MTTYFLEILYKIMVNFELMGLNNTENSMNRNSNTKDIGLKFLKLSRSNFFRYNKAHKMSNHYNLLLFYLESVQNNI